LKYRVTQTGLTFQDLFTKASVYTLAPIAIPHYRY
jgi:hypothetical protein